MDQLKNVEEIERAQSSNTLFLNDVVKSFDGFMLDLGDVYQRNVLVQKHLAYQNDHIQKMVRKAQENRATAVERRQECKSGSTSQALHELAVFARQSKVR